MCLIGVCLVWVTVIIEGQTRAAYGQIITIIIIIQRDSKRWTQICTSIFPELYIVCE